ncbi:basic amino acid ABC transporter substrate-binding protein [Halorussus limi]|uniref:Basic amino acid ABC transporter substrate-binding protein n=1 Tax=Halorussus limi TaxID=2938695 RepID=A0A8U0HUN5_9EURY|nr:basic amino acid ABC transporter substrate-binding protein [Halorussus limi]UPV74782.1 basic amino acid ABC transporter substrate-binding protein [Halorussus limi]
MERRTSVDMDRRTYVKVVGASGVAGLTGTAGCIGSITGSGGGNKKLTAGTAPGFPPFEMKKGGELVGFDIDLLEAVVSESEYTLSGWEEFEFKGLMPALSSEKIDVIAGAMTINEKRDKKIDFSNPYYSADQSILVRKGGDFSPSKLGDFSGHPVGAQKGTTGEGIIKDELIAKGKLKESNYNSYGSYVLAVEDLVNGNIDAIVIDKPVAKTFQSERDVSIAFTYETGEKYGFGVRQGDSDVQKALNNGLKAVRDSGKYTEIRNKWFSDS